ncbi:MAG TPA: hemerythrin domain-containing protein [Chitinophagaceae bacterium]|jgi:hemerythrin-like domain-containing protein|nr:hemerythrin domain-containing protein [Chitinophagaceae bacterium]
MDTKFKSHTAQLSPLSKEHQAGLLFIEQVRKGLDNIELERVRNYVRWYWKNHIRPHFYQEERILLPYLPSDHALVAKVKDDHSNIRDLILELDHGGDAGLFRAFCDVLVAHICFEEQHLFTCLENELSADDLDAINKALQAHPVEDAEWSDLFWQ